MIMHKKTIIFTELEEDIYNNIIKNMESSKRSFSAEVIITLRKSLNNKRKIDENEMENK